MPLEDVYNMDEIGSFYCAQANKMVMQGEVRGLKTQKDCPNLALVVNMTNIDKLKHVIIYKSPQLRCFGRWLPTKLYVVVCKSNNLDDIICI
jgi:hypothetical protein